MVAVKEFSWEEISGPDFGNPARQAWPQAVAQVEEQLRTKLRVEVLPGAHAQGAGAGARQRGDPPGGRHRQRAERQADLHAGAGLPLCGRQAPHRAVQAHARRRAAPPCPGPGGGHGARPGQQRRPSGAQRQPGGSGSGAAARCPAQRARVPGVGRARGACQRVLQVPRGHHGAAVHAAGRGRRRTAAPHHGHPPHLAGGHRSLRRARRTAGRSARSRASGPGAAGTARPAGASAHQRTRRPADAAEAVQQALAAQARWPRTANGAAPSGPAPDDQQTGFCSLHQVQMEQKHNERGTFYGHWLADEKRHCNGRRNGRR